MTLRRLPEWLVWLMIMVAAALPRLVHLDADPPQDVQVHYLADEGLYAHNARNDALFGSWTMDDHNVALFTAPLHTLAVRTSYAVFGTGLWQTRLPGALAGILTCLLVYAFMRRMSTRGAAFASALLLATSSFFLAHNRIAYTESLQTLFVTLGFFAALRSRDAARWAAVCALALIAAVMAKAASLSLVAAIPLIAIVDAARNPSRRRDWGKSGIVFCVTGIAATGIVAALFVVPQWGAYRQQIDEMLRTAAAWPTPWSMWHRLLYLGFRVDPDSVRLLAGWLERDAILAAGVGCAVFARLTRLDPRRLDALDVGCWLWIAIAVATAATHPALPPERRFALIMPALAIVLARAAFDRATDETADRAPSMISLVIAWAGLLILPGIQFRGLVLPLLHSATRGLALGAERGLSGYTVLAALWVASGVLAVVFIALRRRWFGWLARPHWAMAVIAVALAVGGVRATIETLRPRHAIRDAGRMLGRLAAELPERRRAAVGVTAPTFAIETDVFAFPIREWPHAGISLNADGFSRFRPGVVVLTTQDGANVGGPEGFEIEASRKVVRVDLQPGRADGRTVRTEFDVLP